MPARKTRGLKRVINRLNVEVKKIEGGTQKGLHRAGLLVRRSAQKKVPIVSSNLKNSAYVTSIHTVQGPGMLIGFSASYAVFVHENPNAGKSGGKNASTVGGWKFLERAFRENTGEMLSIIRKEARVK